MTMSGLASVLPVVLQSSSGDEGDLFIILIIGFVGGLYLIYDGFNTWKLARLIQDTPTSKVRSMAVGRTELEGTVRKYEHHTVPPYIDQECVYVTWKAEKRERYTDDDGDTHYRWETVANGTEAVAFNLEDGTGNVLVRADQEMPEFDINSEEFSRTVYFEHGQMPPEELSQYIVDFRSRREANTETEDDGGFFDSAIDTVSDLMEADNPLTNTAKRRRYSQTVLPIGTEIYLLGSAHPREAGTMSDGQQDLLEVRRDSETGEFIISDSSESELQSSYSKRGPVETVAGLIVSAVALYFLLSWYILPGA
jgi:hypothetical protein